MTLPAFTPKTRLCSKTVKSIFSRTNHISFGASIIQDDNVKVFSMALNGRKLPSVGSMGHVCLCAAQCHLRPLRVAAALGPALGDVPVM